MRVSSRGTALHHPHSAASTSSLSTSTCHQPNRLYTSRRLNRRERAAAAVAAPTSEQQTAPQAAPDSSWLQGEHEGTTMTKQRRRVVKKQAAKRLALPRQQPQPRIWAAAARSAPLPGTMLWGGKLTPPPGLELLQVWCVCVVYVRVFALCYFLCD